MEAIVTCAQPFDANPDVLIAFYTQGLLFLVFDGAIVLHRVHGDKRLHTWVEARALDLHNSWVAAGIAIIIAAFSQWKTLSMFHLFLCVNLPGAIPITARSTKGNSDPSIWTRVQVAYLFIFGILRIAILACVAYRLRFWSDTPGQCFVLPYSPSHIALILAPAPFIFVAIFRIISDVVLVTALFRWQALYYLGLSDRLGPRTKTKQLLSFERSEGVALFLLSLDWTILTVFLNRDDISGDESTFTFGQVAAVVALVASLYGLVNSYLEYRKQQTLCNTATILRPSHAQTILQRPLPQPRNQHRKPHQLEPQAVHT